MKKIYCSSCLEYMVHFINLTSESHFNYMQDFLDNKGLIENKISFEEFRKRYINFYGKDMEGH